MKPEPTRVRYTPRISFPAGYGGAGVRADLQAGVTVAVFAVPQVMAYAMLAGAAPVHGLYTLVVASLVGAWWGFSPFISTGPSNSAALLCAAALSPFAGRGDPLPLMFVFCLLVGAVRLSLGVVRAGALIDYVSEAAMLGFTVGVGTLIALGQLHHFLGVEASTQPWFIVRVIQVLARIRDVNLAALLIAAGTTALVIGLNRYANRFPVALAAIVVSTLVAEGIAPRWNVARVRDVAVVVSGLPAFRAFAIHPSLIWDLLPFAVAVALIGLIEVATITQALNARRGLEATNDDQEFVGQGVAQLAAAFFQGIPCSGSFSRSALLELTGVQSRLGSVFVSLGMAGALLFCARWLNYIPIAALAGLLFFIGFRLIDVARIRRVWTASRPDGIIIAITAFVTVFVHLLYGIFAGIVASGVMVLRRVTRLQLYELIPGRGRHFEEIGYRPQSRHEPSDIVALDLHGNLFYAQAQSFRTQLGRILDQQRPRFILIRMRRVYSIDFACWHVLWETARELHHRGGRLYLCDVLPEIRPMLLRGGLEEYLGDDQIIPAIGSQYGSLCLAGETVGGRRNQDVPLSDSWRRFFHDGQV